MLVSEIVVDGARLIGRQVSLEGRLRSRDGIRYFLVDTRADDESGPTVDIVAPAVTKLLWKRLPRITGGPFLFDCDVAAVGTLRRITSDAAGRTLVLDDPARLTALIRPEVSYHFAWDGSDSLPQPRRPVADGPAEPITERGTDREPRDDAPVALSGTLRSTHDKHELLSGPTRDLTSPAALALPATELFELVRSYIPSDDQDYLPVCFYEAVVVGRLRTTPDGKGLEMPEVDEVAIQLPNVVVRFVNAEEE